MKPRQTTGNTKARVLQIAYAIALPGLCVAIYLFPPYHFPGGRPFWSQVADHYFYVMYSFVAIGAVTIFVWDLFFPDLLDVFVLSTLSIERRTLFTARIAAVGIFLAIFLLGTNALGTIFFPAAADLPSLIRHLAAHLVAVTMSGLCIASFVLAAQGFLLILLGEHLFRRISPFLQALSITALLSILLLFPLVSRFIETLISSGQRAVFYFPPFWFLGIYERLLDGRETLPAFMALARMGLLTTAAMIILACVSYPLAYRSRMRNVVEGSGARSTRSWFAGPILMLLHRTLLRVPQQRGIFHFIGQTLSRTPRHRVYLAMYGRSWTGAGHFVRSYVQARSRYGRARPLDRRVTSGSSNYRLLDGCGPARRLPRPSRPQGQLDIPHHSRQAGMGRVCGDENVGTHMGARAHAREHRVDSSCRAA